MVLLPEEFGAGVVYVIAVENPGQHPLDRFGGILRGCPVALPSLKTLAGFVVLQVKDRVDE